VCAVVLVLVLLVHFLLSRVVEAHSVGAGSGWVGRRTLCAEELARDVELLAADNNNLLAVQELLGDSGGQAAEKVALAVDDNLCISISHCCSSPYPPSCILQVVRVRAKAYSESGMRTTGSKVDILLRLVRLVIDGLVDVVVVCRRLLDFGDGNSVRAWLGRCAAENWPSRLVRGGVA
jgi:hypothetical protein